MAFQKTKASMLDDEFYESPSERALTREFRQLTTLVLVAVLLMAASTWWWDPVSVFLESGVTGLRQGVRNYPLEAWSASILASIVLSALVCRYWLQLATCQFYGDAPNKRPPVILAVVAAIYGILILVEPDYPPFFWFLFVGMYAPEGTPGWAIEWAVGGFYVLSRMGGYLLVSLLLINLLLNRCSQIELNKENDPV